LISILSQSFFKAQTCNTLRIGLVIATNKILTETKYCYILYIHCTKTVHVQCLYRICTVCDSVWQYVTVCDSSNNLLYFGKNLLCTKPVLSILQARTLKNDQGKGDISFWIYLFIFLSDCIVHYNTITLYWNTHNTTPHCMYTVHSHFTTLQEVWLWSEKSPVLQSKYWAFFANSCITGKFRIMEPLTSLINMILFGF